MNTKEQSHRKNTRLQNKFLAGLAGILIFFSAIASTVIYFYEINVLEEDAYQKAELVMAATEANRRYVREVLRPKMYTLIGEDDFYIEAMSSSYISRSIMDRFSERIPNFTYRRVAINARNRDYEANPLEKEMIEYFAANPAIDEWHGIIEKNNTKTFMRFKPVYFENSCAICHGKPADAPNQIIELYGDRRGFHRQAGQVSGVISVALPVDLNLAQIKEIAIIAFFGVIPSLLILYAIISVFFNRFIVHNIQNVLNIFKNNLEDEQDIKLLEQSKDIDEIGELTGVAQTMSETLNLNRQQLKKYATEMMHSKELLQSVFDGISDPVILVENGSKIKIVNRAFLQRYTLSMAQVLNHRPSEIPTGKCCPLQLCSDIFDTMPQEPISKELQTNDEKIFLIYFYPIHNERGETESLVCYVKDVTEKKRLETKFQQTEKLISMGQLAAGVAHEINNPLGVILCHIDLMKDDKSISAESLEDLKIIEKHADNCKTIVADLLDFARQQKSTKDMYDINEIIQDVAAILNNQLQTQGIVLHLDLDNTISNTLLDPDKLKQVFMNLIINGSHAIVEKGNIYIQSQMAGDAIQISVVDDGSGISKEIGKKIFDPFFTTKPAGQGTGLGLSVSYGIVKEHQGDIRLTSSTDGLTCFIITLPTITLNEHE